MSNENVQAVRELIDAFNRRDFDAAMAPLRDDVTWERFLSRAEATSPAVRGKAELLAVWKSQVEAVDIRVEPEEFIPVGNKVIAPMRMCARGSGSAIELVSVVTWCRPSTTAFSVPRSRLTKVATRPSGLPA